MSAWREVVWPAFQQAWVLYSDDDLIAVDKPPGIACQATDPSVPDDLVARLRAHLTRLNGEDSYLGVHQRLDRDTSGVIVYARSRSSNPSFARQFESGAVRKRYAALVEVTDGLVPRGRVEHFVRYERGRTAVVPRSSKGARRAVTTVTQRERHGDRALLDVRIETGRTHQIRAQLAALGCPVAGDALYGGPWAPRLMLHAERLELDHPRTGKPLRISAPLPPDFPEWLRRDSAETRFPEASALPHRLALALEARWALARAGCSGSTGNPAVSAFRLLNGSGDALPGFAADLYNDFVVIHAYDLEAEQNLSALLDSLMDRCPHDLHGLGDRCGLAVRGIYLKRHAKQLHLARDTRREDIAPVQPLRGQAAPEEMTIDEHGIRYLVRIADGLHTGIFLAHRRNRLEIVRRAAGKKVLNLFAYTGGFTVAAASGGACSTLSVDVSKATLVQLERNLELNGLRSDAHTVLAGDVFDVLESLRRRQERFDLIVVDPPTYAKTKRRRWTSGRDWVTLAYSVFSVAAPGGSVLACSNDARLARLKFRRYLHEAARAAGRRVEQMKDLPPPPDFPAPYGVESPLKSALLQLV